MQLPPYRFIIAFAAGSVKNLPAARIECMRPISSLPCCIRAEGYSFAFMDSTMSTRRMVRLITRLTRRVNKTEIASA